MPVRQVHTADVAQAQGQLTPADKRLESVYAEYATVITRFILRSVRNRELAEDLTSQVFMKALRSLDTTRDSVSIRSWLYRVARTVVLDYHRSLYRLRTQSLDTLVAGNWDVPEPTEEPAHDPNAASLSADQVRWILGRLCERDRLVLTMRFLLCSSVKETAAYLQMREDNLRVVQFRALEKARQVASDSPEFDRRRARRTMSSPRL